MGGPERRTRARPAPCTFAFAQGRRRPLRPASRVGGRFGGGGSGDRARTVHATPKAPPDAIATSSASRAAASGASTSRLISSGAATLGRAAARPAGGEAWAEAVRAATAR